MSDTLFRLSCYSAVGIAVVTSGYWLGLRSVPSPEVTSAHVPGELTWASLDRANRRSGQAGANEAALEDQLAKASALMRHDDGVLARAQLTLMIEEIDPALLGDAFAEACHAAKGRRIPADPIVSAILNRWLKLNPQAAYNASFDVPTWGMPDMRRDTQLELARMPLIELSKRDPVAAYEAWRERMAPLDRDYDNGTEFQLSGVFRSWAEQDFDAALSEIEKLSRDEAKEAVSGVLGAAPDRQSELLATIEQSGDHKLLKDVKSDIVQNMVRGGETKEAIAWVDGQPVEARADLERELAGWWLWEDPHAAGEWYLARGDESDLDHRIETIVRRWAEWEPNAAGEWLGQMADEHGGLADRAKARFARTIVDKDAESALQWLESITDDATRLTAAESIGRQFQRRGEQGNRSLIEASSLADDEKQALLGK